MVFSLHILLLLFFTCFDKLKRVLLDLVLEQPTYYNSKIYPKKLPKYSAIINRVTNGYQGN